MSFLNYDGLKTLVSEIISYFSSQMNDKVDKVSGKGLSTNDFTTAEKEKLSGISEGANNYIHPKYTAKTSGLYKVTVDSTGHVSNVTSVTKDDITDLGIPSSDTNTWRGIQDNLTSSSTTESLSANQGRILKAAVDAKAEKGEKGDAGISVSKIEQTTTSTADAGTNVITVTLSNGTTSTFNVKNGAKGSTGGTGSTGARGSRWSAGTALTGTSTTAITFSGSGITDALVNDMYLNTSTGYVYRCTTAGAASVAKWVYIGSIKGAKGDPGNNATTTAVATTSANGLMSSTDKTKLNETNVGYGTCSTAAATAAKVVTISGNTSWTLVVGSTVRVKFTITNTANNPTLNVNSTGAKPIYYRGSVINVGYLAANRTYEFVYNGTQYELVGDINVDTNTTYSGATSTKAGLMSPADKRKVDALHLETISSTEPTDQSDGDYWLLPI